MNDPQKNGRLDGINTALRQFEKRHAAFQKKYGGSSLPQPAGNHAGQSLSVSAEALAEKLGEKYDAAQALLRKNRASATQNTQAAPAHLINLNQS